MSEKHIVDYDRISQDPRVLHGVVDRLVAIAEGKHMTQEDLADGTLKYKANLGITKAVEVDLRGRMFEHRVAGELPGIRERSNAERITDQRSQGKDVDSSSDSRSA